MKKFLSMIAICLVFPAVLTVQGQVLDYSEFVMYAHNGGPGTTPPGASGYGVIFGSATINGGSIGSAALVQSTSGANMSCNIYSGGKVILANGNTVTGRITAANSAGLIGTTIFQGGSSQVLSGNIDVNGNIVVAGGTVSGIVTHPTGTTYSGPPIGARDHVGYPLSLPTLPTLPTPLSYSAGATNFTNSTTISQGNYGNVTFGGNKTLTLNGPGTYVFNSLQFTSNNAIVYNFQNSANGVFKILIVGDANLAKLNVSTINGGGAARIYWEVHGTGATSASGKDAVTIANGANGGNGSVKFLGTIYAPYAAISLGSGSGSTQYTGALYSGTQIIIQTGVTLTYTYFTDCATVTASAGNDVSFCPGGSAQLGAAPQAGRTYSWSPTTGLSSSTIANPTVTSSTPGTVVYTLTVSQNGCTSTDQVNRTVYTLPTVSAGTYSAVCVNSSSITLSGSPAGGSFSGPGVTGNSFNPSVAGSGTKTITYSYTDNNGCSNSATTNIVVNALPVVSAGTYTSKCLNSSLVTLAGTPTGGSFSGTGVSGNTFDPALAGVGTTTITYSYSDGTCSNTATTSIVVNSIPDVHAGNADSLDCFTATVDLEGSSSTPGAQFSWTATNGGNIVGSINSATPAIDAHGIFTLTVTDPSTGCSATDKDTVGFIDCIFSGIDEDGKSDDLIGIDLTSLFLHYDTVTHSNPNPDLFIIADDKVWVEIVYADGMYNTLLSYLTAAPFNLNPSLFPDNGPDNRLITAEVDIADLWDLNNLNISTGQVLISHIRPVYPAIPTSGPAYSYGDIAQESDVARSGFTVNGAGTKVGVISDSYNTVPGNRANVLDVPTGELPGVSNPSGFTTPVQVLQEYPYGVRSDEGRAMLQIIHDVAPGADLAFASGIISQGNMAQQVRNLAAAGCNTIVDDITYPQAPFFRDGLVSNAIREVTADGVTYVTSAGNFAAKSCEGTFTPTTVPSGNNLTGQAHNFGAGDVYQRLSLDSGVYLGVLQWEDDFYSTDQLAQGAISDLDWYLTYNNGMTLFGMNRDNNGTVLNPLAGDPFEVISFYVNIPAGMSVNANILIIRDSGNVYPSSTKFKYVFFKCPSNSPVINEYSQGNSTVVGHANCDDAITVGAVRYSNTPAYGVTPTIASFSSIGGTELNGTTVSKPDLCAPNGVNTTVELGGPNEDPPYFTAPAHDNFPNFYGTSAAAPHVAGIAALAMEAKMKYYGEQVSPTEMKQLLTNSSIDMYTPGFDFQSGHGLVDADLSLRTFAAPKPDLVSLGTLPSGYQLGDNVASFTITVEANYITTQSQIVFRDIVLATTWIDNHHLSAVVPSFFGNPPFHIYTPPITPDGYDGGVSDSLYFFSALKKEVVIQADDKSKRFGEKVPEFTATVTVDGLSLQAAGLTLADLGLENIQYSTLPANINYMSIVGNYVINPEPEGAFDPGLLELYNYTFNNSFQIPPANGELIIEKMPLVITPANKTVEFGDKIDGQEIEYIYDYDETDIDLSDRGPFLDSLSDLYESGIVKELILIDDRDEFNNQSLTINDLLNLAFLSGTKGIANGTKGIANSSRAIENGLPTDTTFVIDLAYKCLVNYNIDGSIAELEDSIMLLNGTKGIANGTKGIANCSPIADGTALINGTKAIANGTKGIANGTKGIVNSEELDGTSNTNTAVLLHDTDTLTEENPDSTFLMLSINAITGLTAGSHYIIPGAFLSSNFSVTYGVGNLTVNPYEIVVDVRDTNTEYGTAPVYPVQISGYQYDDTAPVIFDGTLTATPDPASQINVGSHTVQAGGLTLKQPTNYTLSFLTGNLSVTPATLTATADNKSRAAGVANPPLTITYSGFKFTDNESVISPPISISTTANLASPPGTYPITLSGGSAANYTLNLVNGTLTVLQPAYCTYLQSHWSNTTSTDCYGVTSTAMLPGLLSPTLSMGDGTRKMNFDVNDAGCLQSKLPAGNTNGQLPNGIVNCTNATGTGYLNNGKFRSNLLGQAISLALSVRNNPSLGTLNISGPYVTTWASTSCSGGTTVPGTRQVYSIPSSVVTYLGANNTVNDLLVLANKALGATLPNNAPSLNNIANALFTISTAFDHCRILSGFTQTSAGARVISPDLSESNGIYMSVYPNPAMEKATVSFVALEGSNTSLDIYSMNGELVSHVMEGITTQAGEFTVDIDCSSMKEGIYFVRLAVDGETSIGKLVIIK